MCSRPNLLPSEPPWRDATSTTACCAAPLASPTVDPDHPFCETAAAALLLVEQPQVRGLAQQVREQNVPLRVVRLLHVLVPHCTRGKHFQHYPGLGVVLRLHEVHEHAPGLVERVAAHGLQLRLCLRHAVQTRLDGHDEEERPVVLVAHAPSPQEPLGIARASSTSA